MTNEQFKDFGTILERVSKLSVQYDYMQSNQGTYDLWFYFGGVRMSISQITNNLRGVKG
jgi:hypothetical protein